MALHFTDSEIENGLVQPCIDLLNQALSGADVEMVDKVVEKFKEAASKLNSNEELNLEKIVSAPFTIGETIAAKTPNTKDDLVFSTLQFIKGIIFGTAGGGLLGLIKAGQKIAAAKKAD